MHVTFREEQKENDKRKISGSRLSNKNDYQTIDYKKTRKEMKVKTSGKPHP